jgi:DNA-binding CsgD family transcriptional regulator
VTKRRTRRRVGSIGPARATEDNVLDLVGSIYEAGADLDRWPSVLRETVRLVGSAGSHLLLTDHRTGAITYSAHANMPDELIEQYNNEYIHICPRYACGKAHPKRDLLWDYQHIDERGIDHSEYYDWLQKCGEGIRYYLGARFRPPDAQEALISYISLAFRKQEGHATREQIHLVGQLLPHFKRALEIARGTGTSQLARCASLEFLNELPDAVILLGASGIVLIANRAALALAMPGGTFRMGTHSVRLHRRDLNARLQQAIASALETASGRSLAGGGILRLPGPPARVLSVVPLIGAVKDKELALARVAIFIRDLQAAVPSTSDLQACFGLTEAEARLARILAQGHSLVEAAAQSGISIHTARAHLKQIFGKTGTHRQADLIRMLEGLARCPLLGN